MSHQPRAVQDGGAAWRVEAAALGAAFDASAGVRAVLLRYAQALHAQVAQTAACNGRHGLEERLARWLLRRTTARTAMRSR